MPLGEVKLFSIVYNQIANVVNDLNNGGVISMLGITHAAIGAILCTTVSPSCSALYVGTAVLSALLPDIDIANSTVSKLVMPIPVVLRRLVMFAAAGFILWLIIQGELKTTIAVSAGIYLVIAILGPHRGFTHSIPGMLLASYAFNTWQPGLIEPFVIGYASHLLADMLAGGIHPLWPIPFHFKLLGIKSGGLIEGLCVTALVIAFVVSL